MKTTSRIVSTVLALAGLVAVNSTASAANTHTVNDPQELPFASGYDVQSITFTLNNDFSLTAEIVPFGVPGDTDGDGDPNTSSDPTIIDQAGVGSTEFIRIAMECGATGPAASCVPNVNFVYNGNNLLVVPADGTITGLDQYVTFDVLMDRYVLTISDLAAFKTALGVASTAVNFGAFSVVASFADNQPDDQVPDSGACEFVSLDPPAVARCDLLLDKVSTVSTVGPIADYSDIGEHDDSDSGRDGDNSGDSDDSDADGSSLVCGCKGKVSQLELMYTGAGLVNVDINRIGPFATDLFDGAVQNGAPFTVTGSDFGPKGFKGTLGVAISISVNGGTPVELHTSCSEPIGEGTVVGDFIVLGGQSRKLTAPLCSMVPDACPANQQVTYTYTVTNNGTDVTGLVVTDDKMVDAVGGPVDLAAGASVQFMADACLFATTTNTAQASAVLAATGEACVSNTDSVTVDLLLPPDAEPCPLTGDSDSDSGYDNNASGDSDDSDADSGDMDCDGDSDIVPLTPIEYEGCGPRFWRRNLPAWSAYAPGDRYDAILGVDAAGNKSLMKTLKGRGGKSQSLGRQAVAAMLNAASPAVNYMYTPGEVVTIVVDAYTTGDFETAASVLKEQNSKGCPLKN